MVGGTYFADKAIYISDRVSWDNCLDRPVGIEMGQKNYCEFLSPEKLIFLLGKPVHQ